MTFFPVIFLSMFKHDSFFSFKLFFFLIVLYLAFIPYKVCKIVANIANIAISKKDFIFNEDIDFVLDESLVVVQLLFLLLLTAAINN